MIAPGTDEVFRRVLDEHLRIRARIDALLVRTQAVARGAASAARLWEATAEFCGHMARHLDYEEEALFPILAKADAWGPVRVSCIREEHRSERAMMAALLEDMTAGTRSRAELIDELVWFLRALEQDMEDEERLALFDEALGAELVIVDQTDG